MRQTIVFILCFYVTCLLLGQTKQATEYQGKVIYKIVNADSPEVMKKKIEDATKNSGANAAEYQELISATEDKRSQLEFEIIFNQTQSIFRHLEILASDDPLEKMQYNMALSTSGGNYVYYKNLPEKKRIKQLNHSGQLINIQQDFDLLDWEITTEQKKIGAYTCIKAIAFREVLDKNKEKTTKTYTAWFTPEIPVPFGPCGIDGLPGLVLEASDNGRFFFHASQIELGAISIDDAEINLRKGGKTITEEKWQEINRREYERIKSRG